MFARLVWFALASGLVAFATQTFFSSVVNAQVTDDARTIRAQHSYKSEVHDIQGMAMVPSDCYDLSVRVRDFDAATTILVFETWEQPYRHCENPLPAAKHFKVAVFAPENIKFKAMLDHEWAPLALSDTKSYAVDSSN